MSIIELKDLKPVPDIVHEYSSNVKDNHVPLIIDNGSANIMKTFPHFVFTFHEFQVRIHAGLAGHVWISLN